jgi:Glycosyl transferase family 2
LVEVVPFIEAVATSPMQTKPIADNFTVVIPTLGRECLRHTLRAISNGTLLPAQIVLAHQGAAGSLDAMLAEFTQMGLKVRYVHSEQRGAAAGRNLGIRQVTTAFFASTDDDCDPQPRWLEEIRQALTRNAHEIVSGQVLPGGAGAPSTITSANPRLFRTVPLRGDHFAGRNFGAALAVFNDTGPFDETELIRYCEDPEWSFRAMAKGHPIRYIPQVAVTHVHWRCLDDMVQLYSRYAFSQGGWFGRRLRRFDITFVVRLGYELMRGCKRWCLGALTADQLRKVNGRAFVIDLLRGVSAGWKGQ